MRIFDELGEAIVNFAHIAACIVLAAFVVMCYGTIARAECTEDNIDPAEISSPNDPIQMVIDCPCINWTASIGPAHHYHLFQDGAMTYFGIQRAVQYCMGQKRVVEELNVEAVSATHGEPVSPVSGSLYIEWVDRQCLNGNRVVDPLSDGRCPQP